MSQAARARATPAWSEGGAVLPAETGRCRSRYQLRDQHPGLLRGWGWGCRNGEVPRPSVRNQSPHSEFQPPQSSPSAVKGLLQLSAPIPMLGGPAEHSSQVCLASRPIQCPGSEVCLLLRPSHRGPPPSVCLSHIKLKKKKPTEQLRMFLIHFFTDILLSSESELYNLVFDRAMAIRMSF